MTAIDRAETSLIFGVLNSGPAGGTSPGHRNLAVSGPGIKRGNKISLAAPVGTNCRLDYSPGVFSLTAEVCLNLSRSVRFLTLLRHRGPVFRRRFCMPSLAGDPMRLRILTRPTGTIDGVSLDYFRVGGVYEVGSELACAFLAERWAELLIGNDAAVFVRSPTPCVENSERSVLVVDDECEIQRLTDPC